MKAQVGDYLKKDGGMTKVVAIRAHSSEYLTSDGGVISDEEITIEDVLLPSEAE